MKDCVHISTTLCQRRITYLVNIFVCIPGCGVHWAKADTLMRTSLSEECLAEVGSIDIVPNQLIRQMEFFVPVTCASFSPERNNKNDFFFVLNKEIPAYVRSLMRQRKENNKISPVEEEIKRCFLVDGWLLKYLPLSGYGWRQSW